MSKYNQRLEAIKMRKQGVSIIKISDVLKVSKSSVNNWCGGVILTDKQIEKLRKNKGISFNTGQRMGAEANRKKRLDSIKESDEWASGMIKKISSKDLLLIATALYWSEGAKTESTSSWMFVNSDPEMILIMKKFLKDILKIDESNIFCRIQINEIHRERIKKVLIFWEKMLGLNSSQMKKPYFVRTKVSKVYDNYDDYHGVCRLSVSKSKRLKYRMLGLIKSVKANLMSA